MRAYVAVILAILALAGGGCSDGMVRPTPTPAQLVQPEIRGIVREVHGGPVQGAIVQVAYRTEWPVVTVTSDAAPESSTAPAIPPAARP